MYLALVHKVAWSPTPAPPNATNTHDFKQQAGYIKFLLNQACKNTHSRSRIATGDHMAVSHYFGLIILSLNVCDFNYTNNGFLTLLIRCMHFLATQDFEHNE